MLQRTFEHFGLPEGVNRDRVRRHAQGGDNAPVVEPLPLIQTIPKTIPKTIQSIPKTIQIIPKTIQTIPKTM